MQRTLIHFCLSAMVGLGLGYLAFDVLAIGQDASEQPVETASSTEATTKTDTNDEAEPATTAVAEDNILKAKGCLGCHAVSGLGLEGGATGPDLSNAFEGVEGKHGKPLTEFLKEPTSAVMSGVIGGNPLTDDEIKQVAALLEQASHSH